MIVGRIIGKITTNEFRFKVEKTVNKFDFVQVNHKQYGFVLCQIIELERNNDVHTAICNVIGYKDKNDHLVKVPRNTFEPDSEVLIAQNEFIEEIIKLEESQTGAYLGHLDGKDIKVNLDLNKLLTKHVVILAKSGAGKSYTVGVLLEEIIEKNIPLLIIDPHGEYSSLKIPNNKDSDQLKKFQIKSKAYIKNVREYGDFSLDNSLVPLKLSSKMILKELLNIIPVKLSNNQIGLLYDTLRNVGEFNLEELNFALEQQESNVKWSIIGIIESLQNQKIFSQNPTPMNELIKQGRCSIINLKGINKPAQEIIVYKLLNDLFENRKKGKIPPFFCVIEEAHNFCPERSFGETKASSTIRNIASEGRKFGLGLAVISQRPARLDKSVISQCTTQIIMKITNPNDLKAVSSSVEGITQESMNEIKNLAIGSALVCGLVDNPLFVNIRPRKTAHGGEAVNILEENKDFIDEFDNFQNENKLALIYPKTSKEDFILMQSDQKEIKTRLIPAVLFNCETKSSNFKILVELIEGKIILNIDTLKSARLPDLSKLSVQEIQALSQAFKLKKFTITEYIKTTGSALDSQMILASLLKKEFLIKDNMGYRLNKEIVLGSLNEYAFYDEVKIEPTKIQPEIQKKSVDQIKEQLSNFTRVIDFSNCNIVNYYT